MSTALAIADAPAALRSAPVEDAAFDAWLKRELARAYGGALKEPVPENLLRILAEAAPRRKRD